MLTLRRQASPTETDLHDQYSHMIDEVLEMINVQRRPRMTMESSVRSQQTDPEAEPQWIAY